MIRFGDINYKSVALKLIFTLLVFSLVHTFFNQLIKGYAKETYNITEFLINYQSGFIRRGLLGEIILQLYKHFNILPYYQILTISITSFLLLIAFFVFQFLKKGYGLFFIPFVFFLGNPILNNFWVRKDCLLMLCFIGVVFFIKRKIHVLNMLLLNVVFVFGLLLHEAFGFFTFPIVFYVLFFKIDFSKEYKREIIFFLKRSLTVCLLVFPAITTFLCTLYFKGSKKEANVIWNSLSNIYFPITNGSTNPEGSIAGLGWSTNYTFGLFKDSITKVNQESIYIPLLTVIVVLTIYYVLSNIQILKNSKLKALNKGGKLEISKVLLFQLGTVLPLFVIGIDYGRWIFFWVITSFILIIYNEDLYFLKSVNKPVNFLNIFFKVEDKRVLLLLSFIVGFPMVFSDSTLQHFLDTTPVIQILKFYSKFFI